MDEKRWADLRDLLADDFAFDGRERTEGADAFVALVSRSLADALTKHAVGVPEIAFDGPESATAVWPFTDVIDERRDGIGRIRGGPGRYHERYACREGEWRIASMRIER